MSTDQSEGPGRVAVITGASSGNDRARLLSVLTVLIPFIGYPRTLNALRALNEVAPRRPRDRHRPAGPGCCTR